MASGSSELVDLEFDFDASVGNRSIRELISALKYRFRESDFARVESILVQREEKLKEEREELQRLNSRLVQEKSEILEKERKAVYAEELWKKKYEELRPRISKLEEDVRWLRTVESNARVSSENGDSGEIKNGIGSSNVIEQNVDLVTGNVGRASEDNKGPRSRIIVQLSDSDDDSVPGEILSLAGLTSQRVADSDCSSQINAQCGTRLLKRKQDSRPNVSEKKNCNSDIFEEEDENVDGTSLTADCKEAKVQKLIHGSDDSLVKHVSEMAASSRSKTVEKFCPTSSQEAEVLRQCEEKMGSERISKNLMRESLLNVPGFCNIDVSSSFSSSSSSSSSSSDSENDLDSGFDFFSAYRNHK